MPASWDSLPNQNTQQQSDGPWPVRHSADTTPVAKPNTGPLWGPCTTTAAGTTHSALPLHGFIHSPPRSQPVFLGASPGPMRNHPSRHLLKIKGSFPPFRKVQTQTCAYDISRPTAWASVLNVAPQFSAQLSSYRSRHPRCRAVSTMLCWASEELRFLSYLIN